MKIFKKTIFLYWIAIPIITVFFLFSADLTGAREPRGDVTTEEGQAVPVAPGGEGFFVQRDAEKAVRDLNDFYRLGLTESRILQLAERLEKEVYPRYPDGIPDLKKYLMDVNETLGLGLSDEQIDMQLQEFTKPERPEDFEIPLRPPKTINKMIERAPSDESAPYFTGSNRLFLFFVNDSGTANNWTTDQKLTARSRVEESETWFQDKDTAGHITSVLWAHFGRSDDPTEYEVNFTNSCSNTWMDQIAQSHGFADLEALLEYYKGYHGDDHIVALFLISEDDRSRACPYIPEWGGAYGLWDERCIIFAYRGSGAALVMRDAGVYKHETLHLYGACDEYLSSQCNTGCGECLLTYPDYRADYLNEHNCEFCTTTPQYCVMRSGAHNDTNNDYICCWTMGQIGWLPDCECTIEAVLKHDLDGLDALTQLRDRVLAKNVEGKQIIGGYYAHSRELTKILLRHPSYGQRAARLIYSFMPKIRRILAGETVTITENKLKNVEKFLNGIRRSTGPALKEFIDKMRKQVLDENFLRQFGIRIER